MPVGSRVGAGVGRTLHVEPLRGVRARYGWCAPETACSRVLHGRRARYVIPAQYVMEPCQSLCRARSDEPQPAGRYPAGARRHVQRREVARRDSGAFHKGPAFSPTPSRKPRRRWVVAHGSGLSELVKPVKTSSLHGFTFVSAVLGSCPPDFYWFVDDAAVPDSSPRHIWFV